MQDDNIDERIWETVVKTDECLNELYVQLVDKLCGSPEWGHRPAQEIAAHVRGLISEIKTKVHALREEQ